MTAVPIFFDACSGIGCFHLGMRGEFTCVGAAEWDEELHPRYINAFNLDEKRMFGSVHGIIDTEKWKSAKQKMMGATMVAGFPCTPFSKSGKQTGKNHKEGTVFWSLLKMMNDLDCPAFIFENVTNLLGEKHEETWKEMREELLKMGFSIDWEKIRVSDLGIPQNRNRVFLVGIKDGLKTENTFFRKEFMEIKNKSYQRLDLLNLITDNGKNLGIEMKSSHKDALIHWRDYFKWLQNGGERGLIKSIAKPLWAMEAWHGNKDDMSYYEIKKLQEIIDNNNGKSLTLKQLKSCLPNSQESMDKKQLISLLPPYFREICQGTGQNYSERVDYALKSRRHMEEVRIHAGEEWIEWIEKLKQFKPSFQKLEWNIGNDLPRKSNAKKPLKEIKTMFKFNLIQFRSSGIRISRAKKWPTMVAIGQVPYVGRTLTSPGWKTLAKLQSIPENFIKKNEALYGSDSEAIKRLGNAVNVEIIKEISSRLVSEFGLIITDSETF